MRRRSGGFTLIELLVVMVIIAILSAAAILSLQTLGRDPPAKQAAEQLRAVLQAVSEQAVMDGDQYGLLVLPHGYRFLRYDGQQWRAVADDSLLRTRTLDPSLTLSLHLDGAPARLPVAATHAAADSEAAATPLPQVLLLSSGEVTPFEITVRGAGQQARYVVRASLLKGVELLTPDQDAS